MNSKLKDDSLDLKFKPDISEVKAWMTPDNFLLGI